MAYRGQGDLWVDAGSSFPGFPPNQWQEAQPRAVFLIIETRQNKTKQKLDEQKTLRDFFSPS